jgi:Polysulphide reductase, NrfD/Molybdopterin oxidoreductase
VFQVLKRHFARYTPELVEQVAGIPQGQFATVCRLVAENWRRDRTTAFVYSLGWTQHTVGVQHIRTAAILQALLGNIGRPGGGILALRGHASIQASTDIPTLFDLLPGYLPMPYAYGNDDLDTYVRAESVQNGFWANTREYMISLLKAWWGDAATADNDFCYDYLPRLTGSHSTYDTVVAQMDGICKGYFLFGQNPAVGSANARMQRKGMANLDWLVVRDLVMIESATWWKDGPEIENGELRTEDIGTEVFFLPVAAHTEKSGSFTNTQRLLQWHHQAVAPAGDARSDLQFTYDLGRRIRAKLAASSSEIDRPVLDLTWDYPTTGEPGDPDADAVLAEINGRGPDGRPLSSYSQLRADGSTACGCWIYCGVRADSINQAARRKPDSEQTWVAPEWGWAWPANRRVLYNRASADPDGRPWSDRKALVWWDPEQARWAGQDVPDFIRHPQDRFQLSGDQPGSGVFPYVTTTYRLTEHHTAAGAHLTGHAELARAAKAGAAGAISLSMMALVHDLGRPTRFLNMLRVLKVTSPMSVGTRILSGYTPMALAAAASAVTRKLPRTGLAATLAAAALGPAVASYTAVLLGDTAAPAWHEAHRELPVVFIGSAATAAGGLGMLAVRPEQAGQAARLAVLGAAGEIIAKRLMMRRLGAKAEPHRQGRAGKLMGAADMLIAAGMASAMLAGRSRVIAPLTGTALMAASALTRFGIFEAGRASARDPKYTVGPQRERLQDRRDRT